MPDGGGAKNRARLWIVVGDIHEETANFKKIPEIAEACGIIVTGDLTQFGGIEEARKVLSELAGLPVLAQIGNMDKPEINEWLTEQGINLHTFVRPLGDGCAIFGVGASTPTPFATPSEFPEEDYARWLEAAWEKAKNYPHTVLVSHNPPKDTACDLIPGGLHVGSSAVREFLEKYGPDICLCGHIHEGRAIDHVGKTLVVNPGTLASGGYALLRQAPDGSISATLGQVPHE